MLPKPYFLQVLDYIMWSNAEFQNHHWWILAEDNTQIGGFLNETLRSTGTVGTIGVFFSLDASSWGQLSHSSSPSVIGDDCGDGFPECGMGIPSTTMPVSHKESYLFNFFCGPFVQIFMDSSIKVWQGYYTLHKLFSPFFLWPANFLNQERIVAFSMRVAKSIREIYCDSGVRGIWCRK